MVAGGSLNRCSRMGRDEELWDHSQDTDLRSTHRLSWQDPVHDPCGIGRQLGTLETREQLSDDAVVSYPASSRKLGHDGDNLVQLHDRLIVQDDVEPARVRLDRAVDQSDACRAAGHRCLASLGAFNSSTASRTARSANRGFPWRRCRWRSKPAIGVRFTGARASRCSAEAYRGSHADALPATSIASSRPAPAGSSTRAMPVQGPAQGPASPIRR